MLHHVETLKHAEVVGETKQSHAIQGVLPDTYELKLRSFFFDLQEAIEPTPYGKNREA